MKQRKNTIGHGFKAFALAFKNSFKNPVAAGEEFFEKASVADSLVMLAIVYLVYNFVSIGAAVVYLIRYTILGMLDGRHIANLFGNIFFPIVYVGLLFAILFGIYAMIRGIFIKRKLNMRAFLSFITAPGIVLIVIALVELLRRMTVYIGRGIPSAIIFGTIEAVLGIIVLMIGYRNTKKVFPDSAQRFVVIAITVAILTIGSYIVTYPIGVLDGWFFTLPM